MRQSPARRRTFLAKLAVAAVVFSACAAVAAPALAAKPVVEYSALVTKVDDGDTLWVRKVVAGQPTGAAFKLRLHWADTPEVGHNSKEHDQPFGPEAREFTSTTLGTVVTVRDRGHSYDRVVADVAEPGGKQLGLDLVEHGLAELDPRYKPPADWLTAQAKAKTARKGLWSGKPIDPWTWRKTGAAKTGAAKK